MKATQKDFAAVAPRAVRACNTFFFCGPDEAGAAAAAQRIAGMLPDPGERIDLAGGDLKRDPVLLADEARQVSLFAAARHIVVRANGDDAHDALANHLAAIDALEGEPCPVLVVASAATDNSRSAKLLDARGDALVAIFYPPDLAQLRDTVRTMGEELGLKLSGEMAGHVARAAGLDVRLARSEVEKLALYLDAGPAAPVAPDMAAWEAVGARTEDDGFMPLVNAVLGGRTERLAGEFARMHELSLNPVGLLLAFERRAAQLAQLNAKMGARGRPKDVVGAEIKARRLFWKDEHDLVEQLDRWRGPKLGRLVGRLIELHRALLASGPVSEVLLTQTLTGIAGAARRTA